MQRRKNYFDRFDRLLEFEIPRSIGGVSDVVETINSLRWTENEAKYSDRKDEAILEAVQRIREKNSSESDYDRRRRQK